MTIRFLFTLWLVLILATGCNPDPRDLGSDNFPQTVSVSLSGDLEAFDPRLVRSSYAVTLEHMLFEGLMRKNYAGRILPAIAESFVVSEDGCTYTFTLRSSVWSDGTPLTAHDFEYAWKSVLSPHFPAPNAYQLYVLKNGRAAKSGEVPLDDVGVKALDDHTLEVVLTTPTPYFLELTTTHFYSPVNRLWASELSEMGGGDPFSMLTNGPFMLSSWKLGDEISVVKNPRYWDNAHVRLDRVNFVITDDSTALQMFQRGKLDWVGSPLGFIPSDAVTTLKEQKKLIITPADGTHFFRVNTGSFPLNNVNIRKALAYAIDRKSIVNHVTQAGQPAATGLVPKHLGIQERPYFEDGNTPEAWSHFQEGLKELAISKDDIPPITLCYAQQERSHKIAQAVQHQWEKALGIKVILETCERSVLIDKLSHNNYQISMGSWFGDIADPINFLEVFKYKDTSTNHTLWENEEYISLLDNSSIETDPIVRRELLSKAEGIIISEMPLIPIYHATFNHLSRGLVGVYFSSLGYLDFTYAFKDFSKEE